MYTKLLTVSDAAKMLGISASTLRRLEENGEVKAYGLKVVYTPGGQRRYLADEIQRVYSQQGFSGQIGFGKRAAILVRDITYAFLENGSALAIRTTIDLPKLRQMLDLAKEKKIPLFFTQTCYNPEHAFSRLWGKKFPSITALEENAYLNQRHPVIADFPFDKDYKTCYVSDLKGTGLSEIMADQQVDTVILVGATASGSIRTTTMEAFQSGLHVILPRGFIGDRSQSLLDFTLLDLSSRYADVVSDEELFSWLAQQH